MSQGSALTHLAYRSCLDALEDVLGTNGKNSVLRFANLENIIENPPDYDPDARMKHEDTTRLFAGVREILGDGGYTVVMQQGSVVMVKNVVSHSVPLQTLIDANLAPVEKLKVAYKAYLTIAGYDPEKVLEHLPESNEFVIHRPDCTECDDVLRSCGKMNGSCRRPSCSFIRGCLAEIGGCFNKEVEVSVVEEACRLIGDDECRYRATYRVL